MADNDNRIYLFDSTLRDGAQTQGVDFTVADKTAIAHALERYGTVAFIDSDSFFLHVRAHAPSFFSWSLSASLLT